MELIKKIFDCVSVYKLKSRTDNRGPMTYVYEDNIAGFEVKETRVYTMPQKGTFFGIHYSDEGRPFSKLVSVIHGREWTMLWISEKIRQHTLNGKP